MNLHVKVVSTAAFWPWLSRMACAFWEASILIDLVHRIYCLLYVKVTTFISLSPNLQSCSSGSSVFAFIDKHFCAVSILVCPWLTMGAKLSREDSWEETSSNQLDNQYGYPQSSYGQDSSSSPHQRHNLPQSSSYPPPPPQQQYYATSQEFGGRDNRKKLDRRYSRIADNYNSLGEVRKTRIFHSMSHIYLG